MTGPGGGEPPCMASQIAPDYFDPMGVDAQQARDVARWRKCERDRLLAARRALRGQGHRVVAAALLQHAGAALAERIGARRGVVVSLYWPIKSEPDLRPLMQALVDQGQRVALPLVETKKAPLVFREWTAQTRMQRGDWNIPVPPPEAPRLTPQIALAPLVGWDNAGYRLGYGGGYFDRTLAALAPRPFTIGVGFHSARLASIYPQAHDIPLDMIVTEAGAQSLDKA